MVSSYTRRSSAMSRVNRQQGYRGLTLIIVIGLALAALAAFFVLVFKPPVKPPTIVQYPSAHLLSSTDDGVNFTTVLEAQASLKQVSDFYTEELSKTNWIVLNNPASTTDKKTVSYENSDQEWGLVLDLDYQSDRHIVTIGLYLQKLGANP